MQIQQMPPDIIFLTAKSCISERDCANFAASCRYVRRIASVVLWKRNLRDNNGSLLIWAAEQNWPRLLQQALEIGLEIDAQKLRLIHKAACAESWACVSFLLENKRDSGVRATKWKDAISSSAGD